VTGTQPNAGATRATGSWTSEEDAKLTRAVANTSKKLCGKDYKTDWIVITTLVPGRTRRQCQNRWHHVLDPSIGRASGRRCKWTTVEDGKLKDAVQTHGGKDWAAISALVPGRTIDQCYNRWHDALDPRIDRRNGRTGQWAEDEDIKLKNAVQTHAGKNWGAIAALVPGRTKTQCRSRWHDALDPCIDGTNGRSGKWTADENLKLKDAVQTHGGKNWGATAALVMGRTKAQCRKRWHDALKPNIGRASGPTGK
jgi:myb proto-oncogene protein